VAKKRFRRKIFFFLCAAMCICGVAALSAFDWIQEEVNINSFLTEFARLRGRMLSSSLVFAHGAQIKASEPGTIVAIIREPDSDTKRFYSTLGNAVIVNHSDDLITVYGNLAEVSVFGDVDSQSVIGVSGSSGWQSGESGLEFQAADIKNRKVINPRILLPHFEAELPLAVSTVTAVNRQNETFALSAAARLASGQYSLYLSGLSGFPYRTSVSVNGAIVETIVYDTLHERNGKLAIYGNRYYTTTEIYPDERTLFLADIVLARGRNTVRVLLSDINNKETQATYSFEVY
jgi:hypothetical protein